MSLDTQFKLKNSPIYIKYLHDNSYWYKTLNRDPNSFNNFIEELKINLKLRPQDKIDKALSTFEMINSILTSFK